MAKVDISGWYLTFTDISVLADGLNKCWQNVVIFLTHADNVRKKAQWNQVKTVILQQC